MPAIVNALCICPETCSITSNRCAQQDQELATRTGMLLDAQLTHNTSLQQKLLQSEQGEDCCNPFKLVLRRICDHHQHLRMRISGLQQLTNAFQKMF